jgi:hypothetical protein
MAKQEFCGNAGSVMIGTHTLGNMNKWNLDVNNPSTEIQKFEQTAVTRKICGAYKWDGAFSGSWDMVSNPALGQRILHTACTGGITVAAKFYIDKATGHYYSGNILIETIPTNTEAGDTNVAQVSFTYVGTGDLTLTTV